jgi:leucyl/phenylalanyl-tRNA--protein transferase
MPAPYLLNENSLEFPPPELATPEGLLAVGGDLSPTRLLEAYRQGIFPWFNPGDPYLWWSPSPRAVLYPRQLKISGSLKKSLHKPYRVTLDTAFRQVISTCSKIPRQNQTGTWISEEMTEAYCTLHEQGFAHSVEVWDEECLIGGLYGLSLGAAFFGESMFHKKRDASKIALHGLCKLAIKFDFDFIDCQIPNPHLASLGVIEVSRSEFLSKLEQSLKQPTRKGPWTAKWHT